MSSSKDQAGLRPRDILSIERGSYIKTILPQVLRSQQPILLLGDPGSGKSVTLRQMALDIARRGGLKGSLRRLPIYVHLGAYTRTRGRKPTSVIEFIKYQLDNVIPGGKYIAKNFEQMLLAGRLILLFDSMDEMPRKDFELRIGMSGSARSHADGHETSSRP